MKLRQSPQTLLVVAQFMQRYEEWKYGYNLSRETGLKSGTLYPILMRLAEHGLLETSWEATSAGRPPRHLYKLTESGLRYARTRASEERAGMATGLVLGEAGAA